MKLVAFKSLFLLLMAGWLAYPGKPIKIYMAGDSTMANKVPKVFPETGWGQVFNEYFKEGVEVDNRAQNGKSTMTFIKENRWKKIVDSLQEGDYVFIEFGHNDEKVDKPEVGVSLEDFKINLVKFVTETRAKKATPVLLTPIMRRSFSAKEGFHDTHGKYPDVIREVAKEYNVALIDMHQKSEKLLRAYGDEPSKKLFNWADSARYEGFPNGVKDNTHLNPEGAHKMAELAVEGIKELKLPLAKYLK